MVRSLKDLVLLFGTGTGSQVIHWPEKPEKPMFDEAEAREGPKDTSPEKALERTYDYEKDVQAMRIARQAMTKYNYEH